MILIISQNDDMSTMDVMKWLRYEGVPCVRINVEDKNVYIERVNIQDNEIVVRSGPHTFDLHRDISVVWMRRGHLPFNFPFLPKKGFYRSIFTSEKISQELINHLNAEIIDLVEYIHATFEEKCIGGYGKGKVNKLKVLKYAHELGIGIPASHIILHRDKLRSHLASGDYITKAISDTFCAETNHIGYTTYTEALEAPIADSVFPDMFPSLIQEQVQKDVELRIFYWFGEVYSMAIFSQNDEQTAVDFRVYNKEKPNRFVPFALPESETTKLRKLMDKLNLRTGSIDMILDRTGRYIFLEVNPVGQFGMVSVPCGYHLERRIAQTLAEFERNFKASSDEIPQDQATQAAPLTPTA